MSDADCTPGREPRSVAASYLYNATAGLSAELTPYTVSLKNLTAKVV